MNVTVDPDTAAAKFCGMSATIVAVKAAVAVAAPSDTVTVTVVVPAEPGVIDSVRLEPLPPNENAVAGSSVVLAAAADSVSEPAPESISFTVTPIGPKVAPAGIVWSAIGRIVGGSLTGWTVTTKVSLTVVAPSLTDTSMVAEPDCSAAGVIEMVRAVPLPPSSSPVLGTTVVFCDTAVTISGPVPLMVNGRLLSGVSSLIVWLPMSLMVGGGLPPTMVKLALEMSKKMLPTASTLMRAVVVAGPAW